MLIIAGFIACIGLFLEKAVIRLADHVSDMVSKRKRYQSMSRYYRTWY